jgi:hypothetical protein
MNSSNYGYTVIKDEPKVSGPASVRRVKMSPEDELIAGLITNRELRSVATAGGLTEEHFERGTGHRGAFRLAMEGANRIRQALNSSGGGTTYAKIRELAPLGIQLSRDRAKALVEQIIERAWARAQSNHAHHGSDGSDPQHRNAAPHHDVPGYDHGGTDDRDDVAGRPGHKGPRPRDEDVTSPHHDAVEHAGDKNNWNDPDWSILDDRRGELPNFPLDVMSPSWQEWAAGAAHGAGVAVDHVLVPLLSVASSLIGTARRVQASKSWSEPFTVWSAILGFSGTGKTPGLDVTKRALSKIERDRKEKTAELQRKRDSEAERARAAYKKWKGQVQEAVDKGVTAPPMPNDAAVPDEFIVPRLYISNATVEKVAVLLQARPRGMLMMCDELAGLFLNLSRYTGGTDREFWLEAWNGKRYVVERVGRPAVEVDHLLVGITGGFQPDKLAKSFKGDDDGLYARICFGWPPEPPYKKLTDDAQEVEPEFENTLVRLIDLPAEEDSKLIISSVPLSLDARGSFEEFRQFAHQAKHALDGRERQWWAKTPAHVLRLAGTLAYLDWARRSAGQPVLVQEPNKIEKQFVDGAVRLVRDYFWPHSRAALRQIGVTERHADARRALRWIRAHGKTEVSREDIRRDALAQSLDADQTQNLLDGLVKAGWLRRVTTRTAGRPIYRWKVNPTLF